MKNKIIFPNFKSPLFASFMFSIILSMYALYSPGFSRTWEMLLITIGTSGLFDLIFYYLRKNEIKVPLSGMGSGLGIFLLFDSTNLELYFFISFFTILAKNYLVYKEKHIFNPTNFSLLIFAFAFSDYSTVNTIRWNGRAELSLLFILAGLAITYYAKRIIMPVTFFITFITGAYLKAIFIPDQKMSHLLLPLMGPAIYFYMFFMITDPKTTPSNKTMQFSFAVMVGLLDSYLRFINNRFDQLLSLFIITILFFFYKSILKKDIYA